MKYLYIIGLILAFSSTVFSFPSIENYSLGYGMLSSGLFTEADSSDGESSIFGSQDFHLLDLSANFYHKRFGLNYILKGAYTILPRESEDGAVDITRWRLSAHVGRKIPGVKILFSGGLGFLGTTSRGNGGTVTLRNSSGTRTFQRPSNTSHANLLMLEGGIDYFFHPRFKFNADLMVNGLLSGKRNINLYLSVSWYNQLSKKKRRSNSRRRRLLLN